ncbi:efflux RND transporter periplasmic adaptor subunit [Paenibacillus sp. TRM 82003]|nr:efflux RND transporter periplasmic adaptor subunit [Paenibacillus sp. TRM 82003]
MSTRWWTENLKRLNRPGRLALTVCVTAAVAIAPGCALLPDEGEEEALPTITAPKLSEKPTYEVLTQTMEEKVQGIGKLMSMREEQVFFTGSGDDDTGTGAGSFRIKEIYVESGQEVEAGALIAELDVADKERELRRARLDFRKEELSMIEIMRKADEYEPEELEQLKIDFELKRTTILELEESIAGAQITAPFNGTVVTLYKKRGDTVQAYDPIAVVSDLSQLVVAAQFSQTNLENVAVGMDTVVSINSAGTFNGKVDRLPTQTNDNGGGNPGNNPGNPNQPEQDSIDKYLLVDLEQPLEGLTRGTPLSVSVITNRKENAVVIPPTALRSYNGRSYVQLVDAEGNKREVDVEVGLQTSTQVEILKGLEPGQKVVGR